MQNDGRFSWRLEESAASYKAPVYSGKTFVEFYLFHSNKDFGLSL